MEAYGVLYTPIYGHILSSSSDLHLRPYPLRVVFITPHSPPYTTKHFCKLATACIGVVRCVWVVAVVCIEFYMTIYGHI